MPSRLPLGSLAACLLAAAGCSREAAPVAGGAGEGEVELTNPHGLFRYRGSGAKRESGIGLRIGGGDSGEILILEVFADGPAAGAGLKEGDELASVDGKPLQGLAVEEAAGLVRGAPGSTVAVEARRAGSTMRLKLKRSPAAMEFTFFPPGVELRLVPREQAGEACAAGGKRQGCHFLLQVAGGCYFSCGE